MHCPSKHVKAHTNCTIENSLKEVVSSILIQSLGPFMGENYPVSSIKITYTGVYIVVSSIKLPKPITENINNA